MHEQDAAESGNIHGIPVLSSAPLYAQNEVRKYRVPSQMDSSTPVEVGDRHSSSEIIQ